jgi:hypothetical protein
MGKLTEQLTSLAAVCNDFERGMIEQMIIAAADYVQAVVVMETKASNYMGRKGTEMQEAVAASDSWRTGRHESLMTKVNIVNRICEAHGRDPVYTGDSQREHYGDFALELVDEIFRQRI